MRFSFSAFSHLFVKRCYQKLLVHQPIVVLPTALLRSGFGATCTLSVTLTPFAVRCGCLCRQISSRTASPLSNEFEWATISSATLLRRAPHLPEKRLLSNSPVSPVTPVFPVTPAKNRKDKKNRKDRKGRCQPPAYGSRGKADRPLPRFADPPCSARTPSAISTTPPILPFRRGGTT